MKQRSKISPKAKVHDFVRLINGQNLVVGDYSQIDDYVVLNAGTKTVLGQFIHIACFSSVIGGGEFFMEDFSGLSAGCRIITGSDDFSGRALTNPTVPPEFTSVQRAAVTIRRHAILGTNVIVFPGVTIGEGAAVGAGTVVRKSLDPWTIYVGVECRPLKRRQREQILQLEKRLLDQINAI